MSVTDRAKEALLALLGAGVPRIDYFTTYRAKVVSQSADGKYVDLQPDDKRIPACSKVVIKYGVPGVTAKFTATYMQLGWENGDPARRYAIAFEDANVSEVVHSSTAMYLGDKAGADKVVTAKDLQFLYFAINAAAPLSNDGGAQLKAQILSALAAGGWSSNPGDAQLGSSRVSAVRNG